MSKYLLTNDYDKKEGKLAKLFIESKSKSEKAKITTMDTIRLFHSESGGYLTVTRRGMVFKQVC
jgi:protein tyrosine/serine phosphatase